MRKHGFTLIELLIVVAIIAILAAIAVPNFLEAQIRSKVTRTRADVRSLATALESYAVDNNNGYPIDGAKANDGQAFWYIPGGQTIAGGTCGLTSPVAYISSGKLVDPFRTVSDATAAKTADAPDSNYFTADDYRRYRYRLFKYSYGGVPAKVPVYEEIHGKWEITGAGPDRTLNFNYPTVDGQGMELSAPYDSTNGTTSRGDVIRTQKFSDGRKPVGY